MDLLLIYLKKKREQLDTARFCSRWRAVSLWHAAHNQLYFSDVCAADFAVAIHVWHVGRVVRWLYISTLTLVLI